MAYLALNDILADSEFMGWQQNPWHHAPAVSAFHFDEKAGLSVLLHFLSSAFSEAFVVYFASNQVLCSTLSLYLQAVLIVLVVQILHSSRLIGSSTAAKSRTFALFLYCGDRSSLLALLVDVLGLFQGVSRVR